MKCLKSITLCTQIHQLCDNESQKTHNIFLKSPKKMLDLLKDIRILLIFWFGVVPSLEKLYQVVVTRNDRANLQPTLNKRAEGAILTIFVTDCSFTSQSLKELYLGSEMKNYEFSYSAIIEEIFCLHFACPKFLLEMKSQSHFVKRYL